MPEYRKDFIINKKIKTRHKLKDWTYFLEESNKIYKHSSNESIVDKTRKQAIKKFLCYIKLIA